MRPVNIIDNKFALSGAQEADTLLDVFQQACDHTCTPVPVNTEGVPSTKGIHVHVHDIVCMYVMYVLQHEKQ